MSDIEFPSGLFAKAPHPNAPSFVKGSLSLKREALIEWLQGKDGEWINCQIKETKDGSKWSVSVDNWKPEQKGERQESRPAQSAPAQSGEFQDDDIPF